MRHIVCGWYTPDYSHWADNLRLDLDALGEPHDIIMVEKATGGWERNTMRKPAMLRDAIRRHDDKIVIFVDVDCSVREPLSDLASIRGDVGLYFRCRYLRDGTARLTARTGTIVAKPIGIVRDLLLEWERLSDAAPRGSVDQRTLPMAIANIAGINIETIDARYCAVRGDAVARPAILHDNASRSHAKVPSWLRALNHITATRDQP